MVPVLSQSKIQLSSSNLNISKDITITPVNNVENSMMYKLKNLPDISFHVVKHKPVFHDHINSRLNPKQFYGSDNESKSVLNRKVLSEIQKNRIQQNSSLQKSTLLKPEKMPIKDINTLKKNDHDTIISKNLKKITKQISYSEVKSIKTQKTNSVNKLPKQSLSLINLDDKNLNTIKTAEETSNTSTSSHEVKTMKDSSSTVNNIENKAHESANEYNLPTDLLLEDPIVTAPHMFDFINVSLNLPEYDSSYVYNDISKQSLHQDNTIKQTIDPWTKMHKDNQLLNELRSYFCGNLIENNIDFETKSMEFPEHSTHEILLNNMLGSSFTNSLENNIGIKRWQPQNEFYKKQKLDNENIF